jgi:hypothetical protein
VCIKTIGPFPAIPPEDRNREPSLPRGDDPAEEQAGWRFKNQMISFEPLAYIMTIPDAFS